MNTKTIFAFSAVFFFCCTNVYILELLIREDPGSGSLITFAQFLFFSVYGFLFTSKCGQEKRKIPMRMYVTLVILFFFSSLLNNYAFNFHIPMPLHMVFRSGSLMANMVLGVFILERKYTRLKYLSVIMITVGIIICTFQTGAHIKEKSDNKIGTRDVTPGVTEDDDISEKYFSWLSEDMFWWSIGILILTLALFLSARMGIFQEMLYVKYGKYPWEALFYTHVLPLPLFVFIAPNLWNHWIKSGESSPFMSYEGIPSARIYLFLNSVAQCMCVGSVYVLTSECTSLTVTLTVTLRKFVSLIFSVIYFQNTFTIAHWIGTLLIFVGTCIFTEVCPRILEAYAKWKSYEKVVLIETISKEKQTAETKLLSSSIK